MRDQYNIPGKVVSHASGIAHLHLDAQACEDRFPKREYAVVFWTDLRSHARPLSASRPDKSCAAGSDRAGAPGDKCGSGLMLRKERPTVPISKDITALEAILGRPLHLARMKGSARGVDGQEREDEAGFAVSVWRVRQAHHTGSPTPPASPPGSGVTRRFACRVGAFPSS